MTLNIPHVPGRPFRSLAFAQMIARVLNAPTNSEQLYASLFGKLLGIFTLTMGLGLGSVEAGQLSVTIEDIRSTKGKVSMVIYQDQQAFDQQDHGKAFLTLETTISDKNQQLILPDLPSGDYAVVILHDENADRQLNLNDRGFPLEGYAYSNNVGELGTPSFKDALVKHQQDQDQVLSLQMIYVK